MTELDANTKRAVDKYPAIAQIHYLEGVIGCAEHKIGTGDHWTGAPATGAIFPDVHPHGLIACQAAKQKADLAHEAGTRASRHEPGGANLAADKTALECCWLAALPTIIDQLGGVGRGCRDEEAYKADTQAAERAAE